MAKIESEKFIGNKAALLLYVGSENLAQSGLQQMRRGVVLANVRTASVIHSCKEKRRHRFLVRFAFDHLAPADCGIVHLDGIEYGDFQTARNESPLVADLTAHFRIKRRVFQDDVQNPFVFPEAHDFCFAGTLFVTDEMRTRIAVGRPAFGSHRVDALLHIGSRTRLLFFHTFLVAFFVD